MRRKTLLFYATLSFHTQPKYILMFAVFAPPHTHTYKSWWAMDSSVFTHSKPNDLSAALPLQMWNGICRPVLFRVHFSHRALYQFPNRVHSLTDNVCEDWARLLGRSAGPGEGPPESLASGLESARCSISFCTICQIVFVQLKTVGYLHLVVRLSSGAGIALTAPVRLFFGGLSITVHESMLEMSPEINSACETTVTINPQSDFSYAMLQRGQWHLWCTIEIFELVGRLLLLDCIICITCWITDFIHIRR